MRATLTSKGQTTIPKEIRDHLHLHPGDKLDFIIEDGGRVVLVPGTTDVTKLKGLLHRQARKSVALEEMDLAIRSTAGRNAK